MLPPRGFGYAMRANAADRQSQFAGVVAGCLGRMLEPSRRELTAETVY